MSAHSELIYDIVQRLLQGRYVEKKKPFYMCVLFWVFIWVLVELTFALRLTRRNRRKNYALVTIQNLIHLLLA